MDFIRWLQYNTAVKYINIIPPWHIRLASSNNGFTLV